MIKSIKQYFEYKKNMKTAKKELAKMAATTLPIIREVSDKSADIVKFVIRLTNETKNVSGNALVSMVLDKTAEILQTDNSRIIEILTYMASLQPEEMQKILVHSVVETMTDSEN